MGNVMSSRTWKRTTSTAQSSSRSSRASMEPSGSALEDSAPARDEDTDHEEGRGVSGRARNQEQMERKINEAMDAMKTLVARQAEIEAERYVRVIEIEKKKLESRREKLAVEREKVAAEGKKAEADKQLMSQMVQIMKRRLVACSLKCLVDPERPTPPRRSLHARRLKTYSF